MDYIEKVDGCKGSKQFIAIDMDLLFLLLEVSGL